MQNKEDMLYYINSEISLYDIDIYNTLTFSQNKIKDFFVKFAISFTDEDVNGIFDYLKERIKNEKK